MEALIDQTKVEFERQKLLLLRSIARAEKLVTSMGTIGENEKDRIQEFIAYNIPRCRFLFEKRQGFRKILKDLSLGKIQKAQALEAISKLRLELMN